MRRFRSTRASDPDPSLFDHQRPDLLEGDPPDRSADAIASLRPFGATLPEPLIVAPIADDAPLEARRLREAEALIGRGRHLDAVQGLRLLLSEAPDAVEPRLLLAQLLADGDEIEEAIGQLSTSLERHRQRPEVLVARGALYARTSRSGEAERDFRNAIKQDATYCPAYRYLGTTLVRRGLVAEGVKVLREAVSLAPQDPEAALYLGEALAAQGRLEDALGALETAIHLTPGDPRGYLIAGRVLDRLGRTEEALEMHRKAREVQTA